MASKKILCPYCFEKFDNTQALYQCESDERDLSGEFKCPRITSEAYDAYWHGQDLNFKNVWEQKSGMVSRLFGAKFDEQRCPQCGYNSRRFVCPHCYNWLPTEMVEGGAEIISVIGSPSSGKTNYIVSLINQMRKYAYKLDLQIAATQIYRDGHKDESTQNVYNRFENRLFTQGDVLAKTAVNQKDIPWIFRLSQQKTRKQIFLVFYDTAGERFNENLKNNVKYLKESSGVIVVLDTLSIPTISKILAKNGLTNVGGKTSGTFMDIQEALTNFDDASKYKKPFAFVFSKFDAVLDHTDELDFNAGEFVIGDRRINSEVIKNGVLDLDKINSISQTIEETLNDQWDEGNFAHYAQGWGNIKKPDPNDPNNNYKFFGVSALGTMPEKNNKISEVKPYRVMDPLVWILYKLGQFNIPVKK